MALYGNTAENLTPRELSQMQHEREMLELQMAHQQRLKQMEVEVLSIETKIGSWLRIPMTIIKLPVLILFVIPMTVYAVTHQEIPEFYQRFFR